MYGRLLLILLLMEITINGCIEYGTENSPDFSDMESWAYQLQNADPINISRSNFDLVVIDYSRDGSDEGRYSPDEIKQIKSSGIIPIAYISIGEAEDYRFYWKGEWIYAPSDWLGRENPEWKGNYAVKYWDEEWKNIIYSYLDKIIEQQFLGVYLDRVDEFEYWSDPENNENVSFPERYTAEMMIEFILDIAEYCRDKYDGTFYVIPQNGERLLEFDNGSLLDAISGWAVEDLFYDGIALIPANDTYERTYYLDKIVSIGKPVLCVDYIDTGTGYHGANKERINDYMKRALTKGYIPYAARADRDLDELNIIDGIQPPVG
ncbi:MAG TPA: hypothetical protein ENG74_02840 [Thermoplasmatales archaeon]|nr:hypothetical protein [Thermoplasmatales archaeon]